MISSSKAPSSNDAIAVLFAVSLTSLSRSQLQYVYDILTAIWGCTRSRKKKLLAFKKNSYLDLLF